LSQTLSGNTTTLTGDGFFKQRTIFSILVRLYEGAIGNDDFQVPVLHAKSPIRVCVVGVMAMVSVGEHLKAIEFADELRDQVLVFPRHFFSLLISRC
jgi:hypothetical protein